jgi:hypothetical protein
MAEVKIGAVRLDVADALGMVAGVVDAILPDDLDVVPATLATVPELIRLGEAGAWEDFAAVAVGAAQTIAAGLVDDDLVTDETIADLAAGLDAIARIAIRASRPRPTRARSMARAILRGTPVRDAVGRYRPEVLRK